MLFSRIASCFAFIVTLGILAVAKPVELDSRASVASVENVVTTLKSKTDVIVPQIKSAAANKDVSAATVAPLISELVSALNTAHASLNQVKARDIEKRQTEDTVATTVAAIVSEIVLALGALPLGLVGLPGLIVSLDVAISELLVGLDVALVGVGLLVGSLLNDVGGLLASLGLTLALGLLGL